MKKTIKCIFVAVFLFGLASCTMLPASMQPDHTVIANIKAGTSINPTLICDAISTERTQRF